MRNLALVVAGFGGQGILSAGRIVAEAGMLQGLEVSWLPSYGPEMRGGTANCHVVLSDTPIGSPVLNACDALIAMNGPSFERFESMVRPGGLVIVDGSLLCPASTRPDIRLLSLPASSVAAEMGNRTFASVILLGCLSAATGAFDRTSFEAALRVVLPPSKQGLIPDEMKAFDLGAASVEAGGDGASGG